jgi:predicted RNA binding protein YcfA (HicA-like mRNA interferase family)
MKVSDLLRLLHDDGWFLVATRGSIDNDDLASGTLNSILKQASLRRN